MVESISSYEKEKCENDEEYDEEESITDLQNNQNLFRIDNYNNSGTQQIKLNEQVPKSVI